MDNPIEVLEAEHKLILKAVQMARQIQGVEDNRIYYELMHDMILFLRNFTEIYHHPKEEDILYPMLQKHKKGLSPEVVHEIYDNHQEFKSLIAEIENYYVMYDYRLLRKTMGDYLTALTAHILRENKLVLSIAGDLISDDDKRNACWAFDELDKKQGEKQALKESLLKIGRNIPVKSDL